MAQVPHKPSDQTRSVVKNLCAMGIERKEVARLLGIHLNTLQKHYKEELNKAQLELKSLAMGKLWEGIEKGDKTLLIFYLKTKCGFVETDRREIKNLDTKEQGPILNITVNRVEEREKGSIIEVKEGGDRPLPPSKTR